MASYPYSNEKIWFPSRFSPLQDIHNVVWCPVASNTLLQKNEKQETYLATSGRDKKIKVWAVAEGKCVAQAKLPGKTGIHRPRPGQYDDKRSSWVALHWLDERRILSSGLSGELLSWEVLNVSDVRDYGSRMTN